MNPVEYCLNVYVKNVEENSQRLRWYHLTIPLAGSMLYMDANMDNINLRTGASALLSIVTSFGSVGLIAKTANFL